MSGSADDGEVVLSATAAQVRTLRARAHGLDARIAGEGAVTAAAGRCGLQDSPPGSALEALHARVEGVTAPLLDRAVAVHRSLVRTWAMRGAPFIVPSSDLSVFTTGALPVDEGARTRLVVGVRGALEQLSGGLDDHVAATGEAVRHVLAGRRLEIDELGRRVAERVEPTLPERDRAAWTATGPYAPGQPLGEAVVHFCLRILTLDQVLCFAPRAGRSAPFVLLDEWLDDVPRLDGRQARRMLAARYLSAYGPSTPVGLARWLGVGTRDASAWWDLLDGALVRVDVDGSDGWLLADDVEGLESARDGSIAGVRLLPPGDPFLQPPERELIVPDPARRRQLWPARHAPGALLLDGEVRGTWRGRVRSRRLEITLDPWHPLPPEARSAIEDAAQALAVVRGSEEAVVDLSGR